MNLHIGFTIRMKELVGIWAPTDALKEGVLAYDPPPPMMKENYCPIVVSLQQTPPDSYDKYKVYASSPHVSGRVGSQPIHHTLHLLQRSPSFPGI